jgi:hypothetical protein
MRLICVDQKFVLQFVAESKLGPARREGAEGSEGFFYFSLVTH